MPFCNWIQDPIPTRLFFLSSIHSTRHQVQPLPGPLPPSRELQVVKDQRGTQHYRCALKSASCRHSVPGKASGGTVLRRELRAGRLAGGSHTLLGPGESGPGVPRSDSAVAIFRSFPTSCSRETQGEGSPPGTWHLLKLTMRNIFSFSETHVMQP